MGSYKPTRHSGLNEVCNKGICVYIVSAKSCFEFGAQDEAERHLKMPGNACMESAFGRSDVSIMAE